MLLSFACTMLNLRSTYKYFRLCICMQFDVVFLFLVPVSLSSTILNILRVWLSEGIPQRLFSSHGLHWSTTLPRPSSYLLLRRPADCLLRYTLSRESFVLVIDHTESVLNLSHLVNSVLCAISEFLFCLTIRGQFLQAYARTGITQ